mgnify:CR=1 FL=1
MKEYLFDFDKKDSSEGAKKTDDSNSHKGSQDSDGSVWDSESDNVWESNPEWAIANYLNSYDDLMGSYGGSYGCFPRRFEPIVEVIPKEEKLMNQEL